MSEVNCVIKSVRFSTSVARARKPPKVGDRRTTKKHGLQIRVWEWSEVYRARVVSNGKPVYEWRKPKDLRPWEQHLLRPGDLEAA